ncbi:hypothetical protein Q7A53_05410 [Halobacillus rhizosphaerae]|uniref:hypothetical protein n=1 Tax=Halobacillus rhizosphaerae TaxID=3064889 RepID=UPI00398B6091
MLYTYETHTMNLKVLAMSNAYFKEVSGGIYYKKKDRHELTFGDFISANFVTHMLNDSENVVIETIEGNLVSNFDLSSLLQDEFSREL